MEVIEEEGKVVDIVSFQPYEKKLSGEVLDKVHAMTGKPIFLSDWSQSFKTDAYDKTMWPQFSNAAEAAASYENYLQMPSPSRTSSATTNANTSIRSTSLVISNRVCERPMDRCTPIGPRALG